MISDIEQLDAFAGGMLSSFKAKYWRTMNSFAHAGFQQVSRHNTPTDIGTNFGDDEVLEVLQATDAFAIMIAQEILLMAGELDAANELTKKMKEL